MIDAPERIWIDPRDRGESNNARWWYAIEDKEFAKDVGANVEYIRADIAEMRYRSES